MLVGKQGGKENVSLIYLFIFLPSESLFPFEWT